jgi:hypothetical protein
MLLFLEVVLTVRAWRKGWGAWALAPVGALAAVAFAMGALIGPEVLHSPLPIVLELAACAGLVGLNVAEPPTASAPFGVKAQV